jgi:hypothetical protein
MEVAEPGVGAPAGNRALDACVVERFGNPESSGRGSCGHPRRRRHCRQMGASVDKPGG